MSEVWRVSTGVETPDLQQPGRVRKVASSVVAGITFVTVLTLAGTLVLAPWAAAAWGIGRYFGPS